MYNGHTELSLTNNPHLTAAAFRQVGRALAPVPWAAAVDAIHLVPHMQPLLTPVLGQLVRPAARIRPGRRLIPGRQHQSRDPILFADPHGDWMLLERHNPNRPRNAALENDLRSPITCIELPGLRSGSQIFCRTHFLQEGGRESNKEEEGKKEGHAGALVAAKRRQVEKDEEKERVKGRSRFRGEWPFWCARAHTCKDKAGEKGREDQSLLGGEIVCYRPLPLSSRCFVPIFSLPHRLMSLSFLQSFFMRQRAASLYSFVF